MGILLLHQLLGPGFAGFQLRTIGTRSEHRQSSFSETIGHPCSQGCFRADHNEINGGVTAVCDQSVGIQLADAKSPTAFEIHGAAVARGDPDVLHPRATA